MDDYRDQDFENVSEDVEESLPILNMQAHLAKSNIMAIRQGTGYVEEKKVLYNSNSC